MNKIPYIKRITVFLIALFIVSLGVAFTTRANMGTSAMACPPYVMSLIPGSPLTMGTYLFIIQVFFVIMQKVLLRDKFPVFQYLQFGMGFFFGLFMDISMWLTASIQPDNYLLRWVELIFGCALVAIGVIGQLKANVLITAGEGFARAISQVGGWRFSNVKISVDVALVLISVAISLIFMHTIEGVREGTVVSAFLVGMLVRFFMPMFSFVDNFIGRTNS